MKPVRHHYMPKINRTLYLCAVMALALLSLNSVIEKAEANENHSGIERSSRVTQYIAHIDRSAFQGNVSIIQQQGNNNQASVLQSRSVSYQLANYSHIKQLGNNNQANIQQNNGNNIGIIWQQGNNHTASISQQGNSLSLRADIYQLGLSGDVTISQSGSGLRDVSVQQQNYSGNTRAVTIDTY